MTTKPPTEVAGYKVKPQRPLTQDEWDVHVASQAARPTCVQCEQPLLLIQPGRERCEACRIEDTRRVVTDRGGLERRNT